MVWQRDRFRRFVREQAAGAILIGAAAATTAICTSSPTIRKTRSTSCRRSVPSPSASSCAPCSAPSTIDVALRAFSSSPPCSFRSAPTLSLKLHPKWWKITDPYVEHGAAIEAAEPGERELGDWIRAHTTPDDAFIDSRMTIPVFAERPLFFPTDLRRANLRGWRPNGWLANPKGILHELEGLPRSLVDSREDLVRALLVDGRTPSDEALAASRSGLLGELYVVCRDAPSSARIATDSRFAKAFANPAATVYRLRVSAARPADS